MNSVMCLGRRSAARQIRRRFLLGARSLYQAFLHSCSADCPHLLQYYESLACYNQSDDSGGRSRLPYQP
jgi:hypothetical protein